MQLLWRLLRAVPDCCPITFSLKYKESAFEGTEQMDELAVALGAVSQAS